MISVIFEKNVVGWAHFNWRCCILEAMLEAIDICRSIPTSGSEAGDCATHCGHCDEKERINIQVRWNLCPHSNVHVFRRRIVCLHNSQVIIINKRIEANKIIEAIYNMFYQFISLLFLLYLWVLNLNVSTFFLFLCFFFVLVVHCLLGPWIRWQEKAWRVL
jgi:hypothetical protein